MSSGQTALATKDLAFAVLAAKAVYDELQRTRVGWEKTITQTVVWWDDLSEAHRELRISRARRCIELVRSDRDRLYGLSLDQRVPATATLISGAMCHPDLGPAFTKDDRARADTTMAKAALAYVLCNLGGHL